MKIGSIIRSKHTSVACKINEVGIVLEVYSRPAGGCGILFESGDYVMYPNGDGWMDIEEIGFEENLSKYEFKNGVLAQQQFYKGEFRNIFDKYIHRVSQWRS